MDSHTWSRSCATLTTRGTKDWADQGRPESKLPTTPVSRESPTSIDILQISPLRPAADALKPMSFSLWSTEQKACLLQVRHSTRYHLNERENYPNERHKKYRYEEGRVTFAGEIQQVLDQDLYSSSSARHGYNRVCGCSLHHPSLSGLDHSHKLRDSIPCTLTARRHALHRTFQCLAQTAQSRF